MFAIAAGAADVVAQVVVRLPVVPRPPRNTDLLNRQQGELNQLLSDQQRTQRQTLQGRRDQEDLIKRKERDRRWIAPVTPYDRPIGAPSTPPPSN